MSLRDQIQTDLADAMRARDQVRTGTLRMLMAAVRNAEIPVAPAGATEEQLAAMAGQGHAALGDDALQDIVQKQVKQRRDSIDQYRKAGREDLAAKEEAEVTVLEAYLPQQAGRDEIVAAARRVMAETGASGPRDMGKVMPVLAREFAGRADGRVINEVVRGLLGA